MSDLSGSLSGGQAISGSLSGGSTLQGGLSMGGVSPAELLNKADVITDTASGSIVSIPDGMASPVLGLSVGIEPIQDLHGQEYPYPAGGGKNKGQLTEATKSNSQQCTITYKEGGVTVISTDAYGRSGYVIPVINGQQYTVSFKCKKVGSPFAIFLNNADAWAYSYKVYSGGDFTTELTTKTCTFTASSEVFFVGIYPQSNGSGLYIEEFQLELGSTATSYAPYSNICPISGRSEVNVYVEETYDAQATPKATIQLGQTVYGGTVDVTEGKLVIDRVAVTFDGSPDEQWAKHGTGSASAYAMRISVSDFKFVQGVITVWSNYLMSLDNSKTWGNYDAFISSNIVGIVTGIRTITTVSDWREYLASNPLEAVYELATPVDVTLTAEELDILYGDNCIFADSGNVSVEYRCDTKKYILKKIAEALNA